MTLPSFSDLATRARRAKQEAKATRRAWKGKPDRARRSRKANEEFLARVKELEGVIDDLEPLLRSGSPYRDDAKEEIGDCFGVMGGTYRDWGRYDRAVEAYDDGWQCERKINRQGKKANSYCLVQRLVVRVLKDPRAFVRSSAIAGVDVSKEMKKAVGTVRDQMEVLRRGDPWAQADLSLLLQLLATVGAKQYRDAKSEWNALDDMRPNRFVYDSTLEVVRLVRERLDPHLDSGAKASWDDLVDRLANPL